MSAHDDYLDPDRWLNQEEDYGFLEIEAELKKRSTGRWHYDKITCCWTDKDADLEPYGYQGCQLVNIDEENVTVIVHGGKTFAGTDICLNLPEDCPEDKYEAAKEAYLDQMGGTIQGSDSPGEWSGDDWFMTYEHAIQVPSIINEETGELEAEKTADAILAACEKDIEGWEAEMRSMDDYAEVLAGWKDGKGKRCKEGKPSKMAAWKQ